MDLMLPGNTLRLRDRDLSEEIANTPLDASLAGVALGALIEAAANALTDKRDQDQSELERKAEEIDGRRERLEEFHAIQKAIKISQDSRYRITTRCHTG